MFSDEHLPMDSNPSSGTTPGSVLSSENERKQRICDFFIVGICNRGDACPYSHDLRTAELGAESSSGKRGFVTNPNVVNADHPKSSRRDIQPGVALEHPMTNYLSGFIPITPNTDPQAHETRMSQMPPDYRTLSMVNDCSVQELMLKANIADAHESVNLQFRSLSSSVNPSRQHLFSMPSSSSVGGSLRPLESTLQSGYSVFPGGSSSAYPEASKGTSSSTFVVTEHERVERSSSAFAPSECFKSIQRSQANQRDGESRGMDFNYQQSRIYSGQMGLPGVQNSGSYVNPSHRDGFEAPQIAFQSYEDPNVQPLMYQSPEYNAMVSTHYNQQTTRSSPHDSLFPANNQGSGVKLRNSFHFANALEAQSPVMDYDSYANSPVQPNSNPNPQQLGIMPLGTRFTKHSSLPPTPNAAQRHRMATTMAMTGFSTPGGSLAPNTPKTTSHRTPQSSGDASFHTSMINCKPHGFQGANVPYMMSDDGQHDVLNPTGPSVDRTLPGNRESMEFWEQAFTGNSWQNSSDSLIQLPSLPSHDTEEIGPLQPPCESITKAIAESAGGIISGIDSGDESIQLFGDAASLFIEIVQDANRCRRSRNNRSNRPSQRHDTRPERRISPHNSGSRPNPIDSPFSNRHLSKTNGTQESLRSSAANESQNHQHSTWLPSTHLSTPTIPRPLPIHCKRPPISSQSFTHTDKFTGSNERPQLFGNSASIKKTQSLRSDEAPSTMEIEANDTKQVSPEFMSIEPRKRSVTQPPVPVGFAVRSGDKNFKDTFKKLKPPTPI